VSQDEISNTSEPVDESSRLERRSPAGAWQTMGQPGPDAHDSASPTMGEKTTAESEEPTIGTGTSIALGCVAGTILLIVIGLLYVLIAALF
jgi:hypothetical protein